ncbi:MAG: polysaccharide biosynthesis tyrosine autokinase [Actinomycetota bacterium]|nr:polysaccharide biosynthesis tyrosine autokinase [Actinomycetota bacterium]
MDFKQFFKVIRRRWLSVVALVVIAIAISGFLSWRTTPQYESTARVFISVNARDTTDAAATGFFLTGRVTTYADLATSTDLMEGVIDDLDLPQSPEQLADQVSATVVPDTTLISLTVRDPDARQAQRTTSWLADRYAEYLTSVETPEGAAEAQILASVTDSASYSPNPVVPRTGLYLAVAGLIGLLIGVATALVREILDRTVSAQEHIKEVTAAPVLASVGFDKEISSSPLLTNLGSFAPRTEAFRLLRTNLQFLDLDDQPRCLVISSAVPGEGKTMTSTNLAVALAQTGRRTLVIDADLRRPRVAGLLGLDAAVGLTTILVGKTEVQDAIQVHEPSGLHFLASGAKPPNPTEILQSRVTHDLIKQLRDEYDMVIIDAPPLLPVADASVLATLADGTILVVKHGKTTRDQLAEAIARLNQVGGRLFGVVVNMIPRRATNSYYYYYYEENDAQGRRKS